MELEQRLAQLSEVVERLQEDLREMQQSDRRQQREIERTHKIALAAIGVVFVSFINGDIAASLGEENLGKVIDYAGLALAGGSVILSTTRSDAPKV